MPRVKTEFRQVSKEMFNEFAKTNPEINITFDQYKEIVYGFNFGFRDHILETGDLVKYIFGLGEFSINKKKTKRTAKVDDKEYIILPIDWKATNEARAKDPNASRVYLFNSHTGGYRFKWYWSIGSARFVLSDIFIFKPYRVSSRKITEYVTKPDSPYIDLYKEYTKK